MFQLRRLMTRRPSCVSTSARNPSSLNSKPHHERALASRRPIEELASELHRSTSHVRQLLAIARERGLLTATTRGRAGGSLTPKAREILEREEEQ
jgi:hypothetical protein